MAMDMAGFSWLSAASQYHLCTVFSHMLFFVSARRTDGETTIDTEEEEENEEDT